MTELEGGPWLPLVEAARRHGVKHDRLRRALVEGRLRGKKIGGVQAGMWFVLQEEVERFLSETRKGPKPKAPKE